VVQDSRDRRPSCPKDICPKTPGYWETQPDAWPKLEEDGACADEFADIEVCGVTGFDLREYLLEPVDGRKNIIMAKHLIAAKLNLYLSGGDTFEDGSCRQKVIDVVNNDAEPWLNDHSCLEGSQKTWDGGEEYKNTLEAFNERRLCDRMKDEEE